MKVEIDVTFNEEQKKEIIEKCMEMLNTTDCTILDVYVLWEEEQKEEIISLCKEKFNEELEKLRSELHETAEMHIDGDYYLRDEWIDEYIDKHISELKGENK